jgi:uncharacterized membrane protein
MLLQGDKVPNTSKKISSVAWITVAVILLTGSLFSLSLYTQAVPGDVRTENQIRLAVILSVILSTFVLLASGGRWLHPHLREADKKQRQNKDKRRQSRRSKF